VTNSFTGTNGQDQGDVAITGGTTVTVTETLGNAVNTTNTHGSVTVTGTANTTTVSVTQDKAATAGASVVGKVNAAVAINDVNAASGTAAGKIATVTLNSFAAATVDSSALTTVNLSGTGTSLGMSRGALTATPTANTLTVNLNGLTLTGDLTDAEAAGDDGFTTVNIVSSTAASTLGSLAIADATTLNISGDAKFTSAGETLTAVTAINVTNTGGATLTTALGTGVTFTGAAGADSIVLGATTKAITMGDGNDTVALSNGVTAVTGTIAGGNGTDTLSMVAADAAVADNGATFASKVTGFERLTLTSVASETVDVAVLGNYNYVKTAGATSLTLTGLTTGATLELTATGTAYTATMAGDAVASSTDVLNVVTSNGTGVAIAFGAVTAGKVETFNITTADTQTTQTNVTDTMTLTAADAKTINVSGTDGLNLTYTGTTATTIDASGITKGAFTWDSGVVAAASTVKGSATGTNTIDLTDTAGIVTYTGGTGNDVIANTNALNNVYTLGNGANSINVGGAAGGGNNTVTGGTGVDTVKLGNGNNVITTAAGDDVIVVGTGANTISAGDGNDSITVGASAGLNTINVGAGTDTVILGATQATATLYTSVTGMAAGDKIDFSGVTTVATAGGTLGAKITLGGSASFLDYVNKGAETVVADGGASLMKWFQFGGNTYVVIDTTVVANVPDDNAIFEAGVDSVIELVGLIDLSTSTFTTADVLTII